MTDWIQLEPPTSPRPSVRPSPQHPQAELTICGYCETQQDENNPICLSCGGPLNDDITSRRNGIDLENVSCGITCEEAANALAKVFG